MNMTTQMSGGGVPACLAAAVNRLAHGVAILDVESTVQYANAAAQAAIQRAGWQIRGGCLAPPGHAEAVAWGQALRAVCLGQSHRMIELRSGGSSGAGLFASLSPVEEGEQVWIIVSFEREELCGPLELQMFSSRHGLTLAENQVLQRLCRGERPATIAREHGVSRSTVLTQVAAIRAKTQRSSVLELMHKLSRLPPLRPAGWVN